MSRPRIRYSVRIPRPEAHLVSVEMSVDDADEGGVLLRMPVWTPGSYLVREFSRYVSRVTACRVSGDEVPVVPIKKPFWTVDGRSILKNIFQQPKPIFILF